MPAGYAPLPNPRSAPDAEREMEDAFDLNDEDDQADTEETPLTRRTAEHPQPETSSTRQETTALSGGAYDFEREYDLPPPGSPPRPSARALPNEIGNSNGLLPTAPVDRPQPQRSFFRRIMGNIIPSQYQPVATDSHSTRLTGGGTDNDGVFANVTAKPAPARVVRSENGDIQIMPEESQKELPPTYQEAQADAVPPYWETTVHAPGSLDPNADLIIEDLPTGSFLIFCVNVFISFFFQFVGFLLTYLLHTSHAAKFGSRAGLGLTLIQYGFASRSINLGEDQVEGTGAQGSENGWTPKPVPSDYNSIPGSSSTTSPSSTSNAEYMMSSSSRDWLSFLFMTLGWFLLLSSVLGFWKVKRWEKSVRPTQPDPVAPEDIERDRHVRRRLEDVFGFAVADPPGQAREHLFQAPGSVQVQMHRSQRDDERLARDLRAAGLI
ncbi:hypothetical protein CPB83DRAFT_846923 [Crepidotus variabilis]|uniref:Metal homeostatis protein bsd2 n=1 Tax=Crepidotus variabilis TaxID=179855 RepID=A0A9P6EP10_9AGAR|nr:hypothetical protein CPB83DRAFT_846923 [Crepidotus variabilis]